MKRQASDLARRLAESAEAVCRYYLPNGRRQGHYWMVGDVLGSKGQSLYVHLTGQRCGRWTDAATGERGDLLDLIRFNLGHLHLRDTFAEARRFLTDPPVRLTYESGVGGHHQDNPEAARRLWRFCKPIAGTLAEAYLQERGITVPLPAKWLRYHPRLFYKAGEESPTETWPAMVAAVTDANGEITGVQRTWLARNGSGKAPLAEPRKALGCLFGNAVRFGTESPIIAAGEGIETVLSVRVVMPRLFCVAALTAAHLAVFQPTAATQRLYILADHDEAGHLASEALSARAIAAGIEVRVLMPREDDFNTDLTRHGPGALAGWIAPQILPDDAARFLLS